MDVQVSFESGGETEGRKGGGCRDELKWGGIQRHQCEI